MPQVIYRSTDASAPVLRGQAGSLVALLDACLVTGYGSKSAAGWTKPYTGTNKAAFRIGGTGHYLRVDDAFNTFIEASVTGYTAMSDVDTGTGLTPASAVRAFRKSNTADATARAWVVAADERTFYLWMQFNGSLYATTGFGEYFSFASSDTSKVLLMARTSLNTSTAQSLEGVGAPSPSAFSITGFEGYLPSSTTAAQAGIMKLAGANTAAASAFPNAVDSLAYLGRHFVVANFSVRGYLRGLYEMLNGGTGVANGDTFSGTGDFAGRTFEVIKSGNRAYAIETSAWDTST